MIDKEVEMAFIRTTNPRSHFQGNMMAPRSPHAPWHLIGTSRESSHQPMEQDEKNDSGVASDCHSSSPGSDYQSPLNTQMNAYGYGTVNLYNHHPLTPSSSGSLISPNSEKEDKDLDATLTPCASPDQPQNDNHLKRLEMSLAKNLQLSPRHSENSMDDLKSDNDADDLADSFKVPKVNSHGKIKTFNCKQCDYVATTKVDQWKHSAVHIREDKRLQCPKCPFVTEYKHHLEYHLRNHAGSKPFKCNKCDYSCVNKSMLNSHMKSHSTVYRYGCLDCTYVTKYCHSLKLHLRRYGHTPKMVLDESGKPCPDFVIDVYGTRRGPKVKRQQKKVEEGPLQAQPFGFNPLVQSPFSAFQFFSNPQLLQLIRERQAMAAAFAAPVAEPERPEDESVPKREDHSSPEPEDGQFPEREDEATPERGNDSVLDLSKPGSSGTQTKNRRKGPVFRRSPAVTYEEEDDDDDTTTMFSNVEVVVKKEGVEENAVSDSNNNNNSNKNNSCQYCNIAFGDEVLYRIHMGYHGFNNPFTCNMCGTECSDKVEFYLHVGRVSHN